MAKSGEVFEADSPPVRTAGNASPADVRNNFSDFRQFLKSLPHSDIFTPRSSFFI